MLLVTINAFQKLVKFCAKYKKVFMLCILVSFAWGYIFYNTYVDDTVKKEVIAESEIIRKVIKNDCDIAYYNEKRVIVFYSEMKVKGEENIKEIKRYLLRSGYRKRPFSKDTIIWEKGKMYIYEQNKAIDNTIFTIHYGKNIYTNGI